MDAPKTPLRKDWVTIGWFIATHVLGLIGLIFYASWSAFAVFMGLYVATAMFGITLGYHRLLTHRSFKAPKWVERTLATVGVLALQRNPVDWVGHHRMHHAGVDTAKDPHDASRGFWWSHIGWMMYSNPEFNDIERLRKFARDIQADPYMRWLSSSPWIEVGLQVALGLALLALGGWSWVFFGIFLRVAFVYHVTWFVNSATHKWGYRNYDSKDLSTNCWWVGILAFGEGWHNNHHAEQDVAPAMRFWWELDLTWQTIRVMKWLGLAYDIKMPKLPMRAGAGGRSRATVHAAPPARTVKAAPSALAG